MAAGPVREKTEGEDADIREGEAKLGVEPCGCNRRLGVRVNERVGGQGRDEVSRVRESGQPLRRVGVTYDKDGRWKVEI
jgi:hypothetical protein